MDVIALMMNLHAMYTIKDGRGRKADILLLKLIKLEMLESMLFILLHTPDQRKPLET